MTCWQSSNMWDCMNSSMSEQSRLFTSSRRRPPGACCVCVSRSKWRSSCFQTSQFGRTGVYLLRPGSSVGKWQDRTFLSQKEFVFLAVEPEYGLKGVGWTPCLVCVCFLTWHHMTTQLLQQLRWERWRWRPEHFLSMRSFSCPRLLIVLVAEGFSLNLSQ